ANYIDYVIADRIVIPKEHHPYYVEKVVTLPHSYQSNDSKRKIAERTPSRTEASLPEQGFVFCCFNNSSKIRPDTFSVWMRLISQVEGSVLWLVDTSAAAVRNLKREAEARGGAAERRGFAPGG